MPLARPTPAGMRNKMFVSADGATISIQDGNTPKHLHPNANEIQYILEGTGTIWLGDKEVKVKPGDLVVIIRRARRMAAPSRTAAPSRRSRSRRRRRRPTTSRC